MHSGNSALFGDRTSPPQSVGSFTARRQAQNGAEDGEAMLETGRSRRIGTGVNAVRDSEGGLTFSTALPEDSAAAARTNAARRSPKQDQPQQRETVSSDASAQQQQQSHQQQEKRDFGKNNTATATAPPLSAQDLRDLAQRGAHAIASAAAEIGSAVLPSPKVVLQAAAAATAAASAQQQQQPAKAPPPAPDDAP